MLAFSPISSAPIAEADGFIHSIDAALAATDATDTASISVSMSTVAPFALLVATEASDTSSISLSLRVNVLDATEAPDSALFALYSGTESSFAITEAPDIVALQMDALWGVLLTPDTPIWELVD